MDISVVIPTLNRASDLRRCLLSLTRQREELLEVVVVDNGSTDGTPEVLSEFDVVTIRDRTRNLSRLFNTGMRAASGDVVAYLNDDSEPFPDWAAGIHQAFSEEPDAAAVGGPTLDQNPRQMESLLNSADHSRLVRAAVWSYDRIVMKGHFLDIGLLFQTGGYSIGGYFRSSTLLKGPRDVDQLTITNVAVRKDLLTALGGFDEGFLFNHADGDFFVRARAAGYRLIFHPRVSVYHHANPAGPVRNPGLLGRDTARFLLKTIEPRNWRDRLGWMANIGAFNLFWIYKTLESGRPEQAKGILGFIQGVAFTIHEGRV